MESLNTDPRTSTLTGDRGARQQLEKVADHLFAALGPDERAEWVGLSSGMHPALVVATDTRLLAISAVGQATQVIKRPFNVTVGRKRLLGRSVDTVDPEGLRLSLLLQEADVWVLQAIGSDSRSPQTAMTQTPLPPPEPREPTASLPPRRSIGAWHWGRPVLDWQDAESMAAAHMADLGFSDATVTPGGGDAGLDVVAQGAVAQVKHREGPTGRPDIQRLYGAGQGSPIRMFYASSFTAGAVAEADRLRIALFQFTPGGLVVAINAAARDIAPPKPEPKRRTAFGTLTLQSRQNRATGWAQQIEQATKAPISNRKRRGAKQLADRQRALELMLQGLEQLKDSDNPLYKRRRRERTVADAEKTLKQAAQILRLQLK